MSRKKKDFEQIAVDLISNLATMGASALVDAVLSHTSGRAAGPRARAPEPEAASDAELEEQARIVAAAELISRQDPEHAAASQILSSPEQLTKAHRRAARVLHTDVSGELSHAAIADLNAARDRVAAFQAKILSGG